MTARPADDGEAPVERLIDGDEYNVLDEEVHVLGPAADELVGLVPAKVAVFVTHRVKQPAVEAGAEEVALGERLRQVCCRDSR